MLVVVNFWNFYTEKAENQLPTSKVIYRFFDSLADYQAAVGSVVTEANEFISKEEITKAVDDYFEGQRHAYFAYSY